MRLVLSKGRLPVCHQKYADAVNLPCESYYSVVQQNGRRKNPFGCGNGLSCGQSGLKGEGLGTGLGVGLVGCG